MQRFALTVVAAGLMSLTGCGMYVDNYVYYPQPGEISIDMPDTLTGSAGRPARSARTDQSRPQRIGHGRPDLRPAGKDQPLIGHDRRPERARLAFPRRSPHLAQRQFPTAQDRQRIQSARSLPVSALLPSCVPIPRSIPVLISDTTQMQFTAPPKTWDSSIKSQDSTTFRYAWSSLEPVRMVRGRPSV